MNVYQQRFRLKKVSKNKEDKDWTNAHQKKKNLG